MTTITKLTEVASAAEDEFADITAKIRPLPENVVPSERFLAQMRRRLLDLEDPKVKSVAA